MLQLGVVQQDSTVVIPLPTRNSSGAGVAPSATLVDGDFDFYKDGSTTAATIDAAATTPSTTMSSTDGVNQLTVDLSADTDFTAGSHWVVWITPATTTIDGQTVAEAIASFTIETDAQKAIRTFNNAVFITDTVVTTTSNTTTAVNLTDFLDAQAPDNSTTGELWLWQDSTGELEYFRVQSMTSLVATVEAWPAGGALSAAVAASDKLWRVGYVDVNTAAINDAQIVGDGNATPFDGA